jgi:ubiquitin carboxyl-terminal hydrolase L5
LLQEIGVKGLQVDDLYSLDPETLESLQPIHALIFLFKWVDPVAEGTKENKDDEAAKKVGGHIVSAEESSDCGIYFATQVINNACATIAAVNAVRDCMVTLLSDRAGSPHCFATTGHEYPSSEI